jgi:hypothetical protein
MRRIANICSYNRKKKKKTSQSLVVYKINCKTCNVDYIGKTERILVHRLKKNQKKKQTSSN